MQSKNSLENLLSLPLIKEIKITIFRPNPDIFADNFEGKIEAHLAHANNQRVTIGYQANPGQSVRATDEIRQISNAALENGEVEVRGRDNEGAVKKSTKNMPEELRGKYDPDETTEQTAFRRLLPGQG